MIYPRENTSLEGIINNALTDHATHFRVAVPGIVESFDGSKQTATVIVACSGSDSDGSEMRLPPLLDVPVSFPRGGGFAVTFPVSPGDEGLLVFSDRCIDGWFQTGSPGIPPDHRLHDLSDASFIPGISSLGRAISELRTDAITLRQLEGNGFVSIDTEGNVDIDGTLLRVHCPVEFAQSVTMDDTLNVAKTLTYQGGMNGSGGDGVAASFSGAITVSGDATISNISYSGHTHQEHGDGGGITGGPQ
jgi:hypothetical protein